MILFHGQLGSFIDQRTFPPTSGRNNNRIDQRRKMFHQIGCLLLPICKILLSGYFSKNKRSFHIPCCILSIRKDRTINDITKYVITKNVIMILLHRWKQYQEKPIQNLIRYKDTTHEYPTICRFWNLTHQKRRQHLRLPPIDLILCALLFTRSNLHADMRLELLQDLKNFRNEFLNIQAEANHSDCI